MRPHAIVLTRNEEANIGRSLQALSFVEQVIVVDSKSTDRTVEIAMGFANVRVLSRPFTSHADQWNFALSQVDPAASWVLALDADFLLTDAVIDEITALPDEGGPAGYWASFDYCIDGTALRGAAYPPVAVLYRRDRARYVQDGHTQRVHIDGVIGRLNGRILHDDRKPLSSWLAAQSRYMRLEADKLRRSPPSELSLLDRLRSWLVVVPPAMFVYCYLLRGGVLDGRKGLYYALQRTAAEVILSLYLLEARLRGAPLAGQPRE